MFGSIDIFEDAKNIAESVFDVISNNMLNIVAGIIVIAVFLLFRRWLSKNIAAIFAKLFKGNPVVGSGIRTSIQDPLKSFFLVLGFYLGFLAMVPPAVVIAALNKLFRIAIIVLITCALVNFTPFATSLVIKFEDKSNRRANAVAIKFIANILKIVIVALSVVVIISELGYNITGLITGLGLGGLTFSLAAQSTASDLFSGFTIVTDKPFDVGDYILTPSVEGVVEDITMRSTRIRTFADTVIVVPNSKLVNEPITNYSRMNKRYVDFTVNLTYGADKETIQSCVSDINEMLERHEDVNKDRILVVFSGFSDSSQDIRIIFFTNTTSYDDSLKVREDIYYKVKDIIKKNGAEFAFPTKTVYVEQV